MIGRSLETEKITLRRTMRRRRRVLAAEAPAAAEHAALNLALAAPPNAKIVAGYWSEGSELDPAPVLERFAALGARIAFPVALHTDAALLFVEAGDRNAWRADAFGMPAPIPTAITLTPDIVVAPLLAFDRAGGRLGRGAGAFDRTIAALRAKGDVFVIGLAYAGQEVPNVPTEPHDQPLDAILTEREYSALR